MASKNIKGITIQIDGDATPLQKALKDVDKSLRNTQNALRDTNKLLKLDPKNTELLTQKQRLLTTAIDDTKTRLTQLKDAQKQAAEQLKNGKIGQEQYDALQREIVETEQKLKSLKKEYKDFGSVAKQQVQAVGEDMKKLGDKMTGVGKNLSMKVTAPLALIGAAGVKSFAEVDKTMQLTRATMGTTAEEAEMLNQAMKDAASNSTFGMNDAATATLNFARAGLNAEEAANALAPAMNLAAGEGGNLDTVSNGLVATINGFHGSFEEAGRYADVFASACNNSALDVNSLSDAMSVAAPIFSAAGYSVEDAALYMGTMANNGIEANVAANSLKTGLARLVKPSKEGAEMLKRLGVSVTNADGSMKDSVVVQEELNKAFSTLSESEQLAAASAIFGKNQMAPWLALINTAPEDVRALSDELGGSSKSIKSFDKELAKAGKSTDKMRDNLKGLGIDAEGFDLAFKQSAGNAQDFAENLWELADDGVALEDVINALGGDMQGLQAAFDATQGTTDQMAESMMSGFGGSLERLKSTVDVLVTTIGESLAPVVQKVTDFLQMLADKFNALTPQQQQMIVTIGLIIAAVGPLLVIIGTLLSSLGTIITVLGALLSPVGLVVAAITALIAVGVLLYKNWDKVKAAAVETWGAIKEFIVNLVGSIKTGIINHFTRVYEFWNNILTKIKEGAVQIWSAIKEFVLNAAGSIRNGIVNHFTRVYEFWSGLWNKVKTAFVNIWTNMRDGITGKISSISDAIKNGIGGAIQWLQDLPSRALEWGRDMIQNFINGIWDRISGVWDAIGNMAQGIVSYIGFSEPDKGPLSKFHTFAPDMLELFASGIEKNKGIVDKAMNDLAGGMNITGNASINADALAANPNNSGIAAMLAQYLPYLAEEQNIYLDSGALVGGTAPAMNTALGQIQIRERRR